ncbi:hypothetical protein [Roseovarius sp.]|uniref:hypothetical protein n=1 Tax=Roseovarius sp. TaxID=1486281 RepID=UPI002631F0C5|nr:hypothetical protein [Roseovarius sp.]MDM8168755.1 hypothetical protein [Roseovarius sp.]
MRSLLLSVAVLGLSATAAAAEFTISFQWGNTPACNNGRAKTIGNPAFVVRGLPAGTETVEFRMKDLDYPQYNHGGGKVRMAGNGTVPAGIFKYKSPCPPGRVHTYQWTATARKGNTVLGTAAASRKFPE